MVESSLISSVYQEIHPNIPEGHLAIGKIKSLVLYNNSSNMVSSCKGEIKFWKFLDIYKTMKTMDYRSDVEVKTIRLEDEFKNIIDQVSSMDVSLDNKWLAVGTEVGFIRIWELETNTHYHTFDPGVQFAFKQSELGDMETTRVTCNYVKFLKDSDTIVSTHVGEKNIRFWNLTHKMITHAFELEFEPPLFHINETEGVIYFVNPLYNFLEMWDMNTKTIVGNSKDSHSDDITGLAHILTPRMNSDDDESTVITCSADMSIRYWESGYRSKFKIPKAHEGKILSMTMAKSRDLFATAGSDLSIKVWHLYRKTPTYSFELAHLSSIVAVSMCYSKDGYFLASACEIPSIRLWALDSNKTRVGVLERICNGKLSQIEILKKPFRALTARQSIKLWSIETKQLLSTLELPKPGVYTLIATGSRDDLIAVANRDRTVILAIIEQGALTFHSELKNYHSGNLLVSSSLIYEPSIQEEITGLNIYRKGEVLLVSCSKGLLKIRNLQKKSDMFIVNNSNWKFSRVQLVANTHQAIFFDQTQNKFGIINVKKSKHQKRITGMATNFAVYTIDKKKLWLYGIEKSDDPRLFIWDLVKMRLIYKTRMMVAGNINAIECFEGKNSILIAAKDKVFYLEFPFKTVTEKIFDGASKNQFYALKTIKDGKYILLGDSLGGLRILRRAW